MVRDLSDTLYYAPHIILNLRYLSEWCDNPYPVQALADEIRWTQSLLDDVTNPWGGFETSVRWPLDQPISLQKFLVKNFYEQYTYCHRVWEIL